MQWRKWLAFLLASVLSLCMAIPVHAEEYENYELDRALTSEISGDVCEADPAPPAPPADTPAPPAEPEQPPAPPETTAPPAPSEEPTEGEHTEHPTLSGEDAPEVEAPTEETMEGDAEDPEGSEEDPADLPEQPSEGTETDSDDGIRDYSSRVQDSSDEGARSQRLTRSDRTTEIPIPISGNGHFVTVEKVIAVANTALYVKEGMSERAMNVGRLAEGGVVYILDEPEDEEGREIDWYYIESGEVRGFLRRGDVTICENLTSREMARMRTAEHAVALKSPAENHVYTYCLKTTEETMIDRVYAVASCDTKLLDAMEEDAVCVGEMSKGALAYRIEAVDDTWLYLESGSVRGFARAEDFKSGRKINNKVVSKGEKSYPKAKTLVTRTRNAAFAYTKTSPVPGIIAGDKKANLYENLNDYEGSSCVPGIHEGGEIQMGRMIETLMEAYGHHTGSTFEEMQKAGREKTLEDDLQTGDVLVYQASDSHIAEDGEYCFGIYMKDNQVLVRTKNRKKLRCVKLKKLDTVKVLRFMEDYQYQLIGAGVAEVNATPEMYGTNLGVFKLTFYCACSGCQGPFANGITSTGKKAQEGRTIAVDPRIIPYGTKVIIGGHVFTAEDCGGAIKGNRIDVFVNSHRVGNALGVEYANVFLCKN